MIVKSSILKTQNYYFRLLHLVILFCSPNGERPISFAELVDEPDMGTIINHSRISGFVCTLQLEYSLLTYHLNLFFPFALLSAGSFLLSVSTNFVFPTDSQTIIN